MEVFEAVRTIVAVREYQNKPVPPLTPPAASSRPPGSPSAANAGPDTPS